MTSEVAGCQAILEGKPVSIINVKIVDQLMQNAYSCVILYIKHKKLPLLAVLT